MKYKKIIIAAVTPSLVIGKDNDLPWPQADLKGDKKRFKELTAGHTVLMGRKTFQSLPESSRPLPNRMNFVISYSDQDWWNSVPDQENLRKFRVLSNAVHYFENSSAFSEKEHEDQEKKLFFIGGTQIYAEALKFQMADELILTETKKEYDGNIFFPQFNKTEWSQELLDETDEYKVVRYYKPR